MCAPLAVAPLGWAAAGLLGGMLASKALTPKIPAAAPAAAAPAATPPAPTKPEAPPVSVSAQTPKQASKSPDVQALKRLNAGVNNGVNATSSSTLLTGPTGIDTSQLSIGRNTLLGS